jgi:hypothetical protein
VVEARPEECFFWRTHAGAEIDLLVVSGRYRFGFEIKRTSQAGSGGTLLLKLLYKPPPASTAHCISITWPASLAHRPRSGQAPPSPRTSNSGPRTSTGLPRPRGAPPYGVRNVTTWVPALPMGPHAVVCERPGHREPHPQRSERGGAHEARALSDWVIAPTTMTTAIPLPTVAMAATALAQQHAVGTATAWVAGLAAPPRAVVVGVPPRGHPCGPEARN